MPEILSAIEDNRSFTLLGGADCEGQAMMMLPDFVASRYPGGPVANGAHVQLAIESRFGDYPNAAAFRYVRGCSGFTGFSRGGPGDRTELERFSLAGEALVGHARWREWGTEQVASSFLLANEPGTLALPYTRYANYWNAPLGDDVRFLHFVGTHRHSTGEYRRHTRAAIRQLGRHAPTPTPKQAQLAPAPSTLIVKASTPRLNTKAARQWSVVMRRMRVWVSAVSDVWNVIPSVKLK